MRFECRSTYHPKPLEPDDYIRPHDISVICSSSDDEEVVAARLAVDHLDILRAELEGQSVCHICDADSADWEHVYSATIEPAIDFAEIREDFGFRDPVNGLVFIHRAVFHPSTRDWQRLIIDSVCNMFPEDTAVVMRKDTTDLTDKELASLGFRIVAGWDLLFRPNMLKRDYDTAEDERHPVLSLKVPADAGEYVKQEWRREERADSHDYDVG